MLLFGGFSKFEIQTTVLRSDFLVLADLVCDFGLGTSELEKSVVCSFQ